MVKVLDVQITRLLEGARYRCFCNECMSCFYCCVTCLLIARVIFPPRIVRLQRENICMLSRRTFLFKKTYRLTLHMASFLVAPSPTARSISTLSKLWKRILDVFFSPDYWFRLSVRPFWAFWKHFVEKKLEQRFTTFELSVNNSCACTVHSSRMNWRVNKLPLNDFLFIKYCRDHFVCIY